MERERLMLEAEQDQELIAQHLARYEFAGRYVAGRSVLDVACGTGYGSSVLLDAGAQQVIGMDRSSAAIEYARTRYQQPGILFKEGKAEEMQMKGIFDIIVSFETIEHLDDPQLFLDGVGQAMRDDGVFIVSTPVRERGTVSDRPANPFHVREWTEPEFMELLKSRFSHIELRYQFRLKRRFPGNRMIIKYAMNILRRSTTLEFLKFRVCESPPIGFKLLSEPGIMLALCRLPNRTEL